MVTAIKEGPVPILLPPLIPEEGSSLDALINASLVYQETWHKLKERVTILADSDMFPARNQMFHINHGPRHWVAVAKTAERLWEVICESARSWWSPESAFLLKSAAYLHDIAMIYGDHHLKNLPHFITERFERLGFGKINTLTPEAARTPLGHYLLRRSQGEVAAKVVLEWYEREKTLSLLTQATVRRLAFLVQNYASIDSKAERKARNLDRSDRLLALAAVIQFSDWSHLDGSRVEQDALSMLTRQVEGQLSNWAENKWENIPADGSLACALPKFYRSHYVFGRRLEKGASQVRFSVRVAIPPGFTNFESNSAFRQLQEEWRARLYPTRMQRRPLVGDLLKRYSGVDLIYSEPIIEEDAQGDGHGFLEVPPIVSDFWVASHWFNLGEAAQLLRDLEPRALNGEMGQDYDPVDLYKEFDSRRECRDGLRPRLSRRAFLLAHLEITRGDPRLASVFFRQLHHDICCHHFPPGDTKKRLADSIIGAFLATRDYFVGRWNDEADILIREEEEQKVLGHLSSMLGTVTKQTLRTRYWYSSFEFSADAFIGQMREEGISKRVAVRVLHKCRRTKALARASGSCLLHLRQGAVPSIALLLHSDPFEQIWVNLAQLG